MTGECTRAEVLAGAVALGEASDCDREEYRRHLAGCSRCLATLGGEREIERVMSVVASARDGETWLPDLRTALVARHRRRTVSWRWGVSAVAIAIAASVGIHALVAAGIPKVSAGAASAGAAPAPVTVSYNGMHVTLEHRTPVQSHRPAQTAAADRQLVVVHNVVTLQHQAPVHAAVAPPQRVAPAVQAAQKASTGVVVAAAPTLHDETSISALRTAATAPPAARAESLALFASAPVVRDVVPLGGETAIVPAPAPIAYDEGAEGTTAFEVSVDERGTPVKCTITKPSGYLVLDVAVCKAAMHARYSPRTLNGHPVPGVYHDAFTFRNNNE